MCSRAESTRNKPTVPAHSKIIPRPGSTRNSGMGIGTENRVLHRDNRHQCGGEQSGYPDCSAEQEDEDHHQSPDTEPEYLGPFGGLLLYVDSSGLPGHTRESVAIRRLYL